MLEASKVHGLNAEPLNGRYAAMSQQPHRITSSCFQFQ